ncbi:MAG: hypothetical protein GX444_02230 [Myxococcales bacterium]|nr:hypothetical protein [Myxococcales bacterium]
MNRWSDFSVTFSDAVDLTDEQFGIFAVEWPILTGLQKLNSDALAWPMRNGLLLNNPLTTLLNKGSTEAEMHLGDLDPVSIEKIDASTITMFYPLGYDMSMQFFTYYRPNYYSGFLWYTTDPNMKAKQFVFKANSATDYSVSFIHYNDDVCDEYYPDEYRGQGVRFYRVCNKKDFGPIEYEIRQEHFSYIPPGQSTINRIKGNWMEAAKWYRNWVRSEAANIPWLSDNTPIKQRSGRYADFYRYTGFNFGQIGAEYALADPKADGYDPDIPSQDDDNFLRQYHDILFSDPDNPTKPAMVNYVLGWDFHHGIEASGGEDVRFVGRQNGKCGIAGNCTDPWADWEATFGPTNEQNYSDDPRMNRDVIMSGDGTPVLGYINPYLFSLNMYYSDSDPAPYDWAEWTNAVGETSRTPWMGHTNYPLNLNCTETVEGSCIMDPTQIDFYTHFIERSRHLVLDPFDVDPPNPDSPAAENRIDGLYHDIGVSYVVPMVFRSHPSDDIIKAHRPDLGLNQVGSGGFVWEVQRDMIDATRHNPWSNQQDMLLGTEQMTEIFIDLFDYYGAGENSLGPLRRYSSLGQYCQQRNFFQQDRWIMEGDAKEIPMLQYVYHPMMPIRNDGAWFSGGEGSTYNSGDIYYWVLAREYLEYGATISMWFTDAEMDVLSDNTNYDFLPSMDPQTPSYRLDWVRTQESTETLTASDTQPGKHGYDSIERAVGDPKKEAFLRLMAALRSYVIPDFLVSGDMRTTGIKPYSTQQGEYSYYFYTSLGHKLCQNDNLWEHCSNPLLGQYDPLDPTATHCVNDRDPFVAEKVVTASWQDYQASGTPTKILHIGANLYNGNPLNFIFVLDPMTNFSNPAYFKVKVISPEDEDPTAVSVSYSGTFNPGSVKYLSINGMPAHSVVLILVCQSSANCNY